jgi:hypothetical protein
MTGGGHCECMDVDGSSVTFNGKIFVDDERAASITTLRSDDLQMSRELREKPQLTRMLL